MGRNKSHKSKTIAAIAILAITGAGVWYFTKGGDQPGEDQHLLSTVRIGSIENTISAAGSLKPSNYLDVGAQVSGQLQQLHVEVGDEVEEGQLLAEIDARVQEARVEASRASLDGQKAQLDSRRSALELARSNAQRQERLFAANASSQLEFDSAIDRLSAAEASLIQLQKQIEQSEASLLTEETELEYAKIYAPIGGTVVSIAMNVGRTLNASQQAPTILQIADLNTMTVETEVSEADISKVEKGMKVYFTTLGNGQRRWHSTLRQILPTPVVTNNVVLYTGLFDIDNSDATLLPEMTTQVYFISSAAENVLVVPMGALTFIEEPMGMDGSVSAQAPGAAGPMAAGGAGSPDFSQLAERIQSGDIPPEAVERFRQARASGSFPSGAAGFRGAGTGTNQRSERSLATVTVVDAEGNQEVREVVIGLTSRISAEVITGLSVGEKVVAGIIQANTGQEDSNNNNFRPRFMMR